MSNEMILEMQGITKIYPNGVIANDNISFSCKKGEIHALLGENGAGKSTLMKILFGIETPTSGTIKVKSETLEIKDPLMAIEHGIGMVHQHFMLVNELTVAENLVLGKEPNKGIIFNKDEAIKITEKLANEYNFNLDPRAKVEELSVGAKQKLEILKVLFRGADLLILDEPTAVLTPQETTQLFDSLRELRDKGHTIIFISHKLDEVIQLCQSYTILRHGKVVSNGVLGDITPNELSNMMIGRVMKDEGISRYIKGEHPTVISIRDISYKTKEGIIKLNHVDLDLPKGVITGIVGVEGNGQDELAECLIGSETPTSGDIVFEGSSIIEKNILERRKLGISCISEDRMKYGIAPGTKIYENLIPNKIYGDEYSKGIFLDKDKIIKISTELIEKFGIVCTGPESIIDSLSGGNIQKVVVARELTDGSKYLIANQPTRGVDVGAAEFIREKLIEAAHEQGIGVLLISADLHEVMSMSDEIYVMYNGRVATHFTDVEDLSEETIGLYMLGLKGDKEVKA